MSLQLRAADLLRYEIVRYWRILRDHEEEPPEVRIPSCRIKGGKAIRAHSGAYDRLTGDDSGTGSYSYNGGGRRV